MFWNKGSHAMFVSEPVVINSVYFTASPMFGGWIFQTISIKGGAL